MKILFITIAFAPDEFSESIVNSKLVLSLKNSGHQVNVISRKMYGFTYASEWNEPWISLKNSTNQIEYETGNKFFRLLDFAKCSIKILFPLEGVRWVYRAIIQAEKLLKNEQYDVIITRSPSDIPHIVGLKLKGKFNIPWIANWNDPSNGILPKPYRNNTNRIINSISHFYTQKILKRADYNTFPCERLRSHFLKFYKFNIEKTEIIPHIGIKFLRNNLSSPEKDNLLICHAGSLSVERNPDILFKGIAAVNRNTKDFKIQLTILGIADQQVKDLIIKYSLNNEIIIVGNKPYLEALHIMKTFDVLCIVEARLEEGIFLPSKLSDYVFLNKPVLCLSPPKGTLNDIIIEFGGGIVVNNEDDESVYKGLLELIECKKENQLSSKLNSDRISSYLSTEKVLEKYELIFSKIMTSNNFSAC